MLRAGESRQRSRRRKLAFGQPVETRYDFSKAAVILSLDADFLYAGFPGNTRYIRDFASRRNPDAEMSRLYVIESTPSSTGLKADHRLPVRASEVEGFFRTLANDDWRERRQGSERSRAQRE